MIVGLSDLAKISLITQPWDRWYFYGDLGAGKTTLIQAIIQHNFWFWRSVVSPTYTYYRSYDHQVYHFDCYRLTSYEDFVNIGWEEIFDDTNTLIFVEWPDIIASHYMATKIVRLAYHSDLARQLSVFDVVSQQYLIP